jgi:hypothetical protein
MPSLLPIPTSICILVISAGGAYQTGVPSSSLSNVFTGADEVHGACDIHDEVFQQP